MQKIDFNKDWMCRCLTRDEEAYPVTLPHDAMLSEPRTQESTGEGNIGWYIGGDYEYTRNFFVPEEYKGKKVLIEFEGIYHNGEVYINGKKAAYRPYGYTNFYVDTEGFFQYGKENGVNVAVYRFPNLMGHSRPKYNSAVSTFCWAVANDEEFTVNDRSTELELLYIDDLVEGMFDLLEGKEQNCEFDGVETVADENGRYCYVPVTHKVTLGEIVDLLQEFKEQPVTLMMPKMPDGSFAKKLYSLYLTYLPTEKFKYALKMNVDDRGSFTELVHTQDCGQVSVNISRPGITKGQHWHNSKWELFIVVAGHGLIQERNINTGEKVEFEVSGDKIEAIHMIPGWTHNIINLSETENLVTVMTCNEIFDSNHPDTFGEPV